MNCSHLPTATSRRDFLRATSAGLGRLIRTDEIASLVSYLLCPAAAAITGQDLQICGGASLPR